MFEDSEGAFVLVGGYAAVRHGIDVSVKGPEIDVHFGKLELPYSPPEGMFTRTATMVDKDADAASADYIGTSSPGIPGQSGGPTFDSSAVVWAIQSRTLTIDLGLDGVRTVEARRAETPQFVSLGLGSHVDSVRAALDERYIAYRI